MGGGELELIRWLQGARRSRRPARGEAGILIDLGDDMAELQVVGGGSILVGTDMLLDGTHFDGRIHAPQQIGAKAAGCCLSDCAAMAVRPLAMLVSVALPKAKVYDLGRPLLESMMEQAERFGCPVVGGDTTSWDGPMVIDVVTAAERWPECQPVRRDGARPGDILFVTGPLGGSSLGRHLDFTPRVAEARRIVELLHQDLHAMIDISDGLSLDLNRICQASGCGATLIEEQLQAVISAEARTFAQRDGRSPLDHVLEDGEDFELLLAVAPAAIRSLADSGPPCYPVGMVTPGGLEMKTSDGHTSRLEPRGYVH